MSQGYTCPHCGNVIHPGYGYQAGAPLQCMNCGQHSLPPASPGGLSPLDQHPPQQHYAQQQHYAPQQQYAPQQPAGPYQGGQAAHSYSPVAAGGSTFLGRLGTRLMIRLVVGVCAMLILGAGTAGLALCAGIMSLFSPEDPSIAADPAPASTGSGAISPVDPAGALTGSPVTTPGAGIFGASVPFGHDRVTETTVDALQYKWDESKERFRANVKYELSLGSRKLTWSGDTIYTPTTKAPTATARPELPGGPLERERQGNGTGFVVRPDGYIATCAHVVEDAHEIIAVINGSEYPAKVIAVDSDADVAIVRIRANGLPHLPILEPSSIRLAEDVRVFGYPLADRLGESIKITRGTVSGMTGEGTEKVLQLDVTVNPGNSGGPLINDRGQVAGVVTALLSGASISEVSFAAGTGSLVKLMDKAGLKYEHASGGTVLAGPELASRVTRSVALLKVKAGGGRAAPVEQVVLDYRSSWSESVTNSGILASPNIHHEREEGSISVGLDGEVVSSNAEFNVLRSLGLASLIAIEPLAPGNQEEWQVTRTVMIPEKKTETVQSGRRPPYPPRSPYGPPRLPWERRPSAPATRTSTKVHPSVEVRHYQILKDEGDLVHIKKLVRLRTFDPEGRSETPYMQVSGQGVFIFNKAKGLPDSLDFSGTVQVLKDGSLLTIPFKITYSVDGEQAIKASEADLQRRIAESKAKMKKLEEERKANAIPVSKGLDKLDLAP